MKTDSDLVAECCKGLSGRISDKRVREMLSLALTINIDSFKREPEYPKIRETLKLFAIVASKNDKKDLKITDVLNNYSKYLDIQLPNTAFTLRDLFHIAVKSFCGYESSIKILNSKINNIIPEIIKINKFAKIKENSK